MTAYNVKPGDNALVIGSIFGPNGPSVGRRVLVHSHCPARSEADAEYSALNNAAFDPLLYCPDSPYEKEHTVWGKIWPCTCLDGKPFATEHGTLESYGDIPDHFLRKIEPPEDTTEDTVSSVGCDSNAS